VSPQQRSPASIVDAISERLPAREDRPSFVQGLTLGALVGAAIAGSTLWNRWQRRRDRAVHGDVVESSDADVDSGSSPS
jgi:hypothetical protein